MPLRRNAVGGLGAMAISTNIGSVVATQDEQIDLSTLFSVTPGASDPTYLIVSGLDRDEYTAGYNTADMGSLSGGGATQKFSNGGGDAWSVGIVYTYQASTGQYYNATYGYFDQTTFTASSNVNDNVSLSVYTTSNYGLATEDAANPYTLEQNPGAFGYVGSVSVVTQPSDAGSAATQATPDSVCAAAESFVGKAWNMDGCWVLTSNISAEAGASLSASSTLVAVPGVANGEWIVAYNGPVSANANWELSVTAGEMVGFVTTSGGGHITTIVSGSGTSAMLIDNIEYINNNGSIANPADDGSASDIIIAAPHAATQEFNGVNPSDVVVYELDTPTVSDLVTSVTVAKQTSQSLASLFKASNPVASQAITEWQVYDTNSNDSITVGGVTESADHSAAAAATVTSLSTVALLTGAVAGSDAIDVRAFNGSYWGDWQSLAATVTGTAAPGPATAPTVTDQTANQTWTHGQKISLALPANTFTDPQSETLTYTATQSNGQALPSWLSFNAATKTFAGTVPIGVASLTLKITATDTSGLSTAETFGVTVPAVAPTVTGQTANQTWLQGQKISLALPAKTFTDPQNEALTYTASQSNGQALPSWLSFNVSTRTLSGTVPTTGMESLTLQVTATDTAGKSTAETFGVTVPAALAPNVTDQTTNQTWLQGQKISLELPAKAFTDPQSETLTYTACQFNGQALPSWLSFNATTKTFSGTVPIIGMESLILQVTATDASGKSTAETFDVTVPVAVAPTVTGQTANQTWLQGQKISLVLPAKAFTDPQSETLTYTASQSDGHALPSWLSFNVTTKTFSGTVPTTGIESLTLKVTATNASGMSTAETFGVAVPAAVAPTVTGQTASQTWTQGQKISLALAAKTFTDPQSETLAYTASQSNGQAPPSWLSFNAATHTFSGTVPTGMESLTLMVTATDASGLSTAETFGVTVPAAAPTVTQQTASQIWAQGQKISLALPTKTFTDPQSETLIYTASQSKGQALPSWLSFNAATDTFSGTVPAGVESLTLKVTATDTSGLSASETFGVAVPASVVPLSASASTAGGTSPFGDTIAISASNSVINPGTGSYQMQFLPGTVADTVVLYAGGTDQIAGFNVGAGDGLDLRTLIAGSNVDLAAVSAHLASYVTVSDQGANAALLFDPSGHGGGSVVAILDNLGSTVTNLAALTNHGALMFS